MTEIEIKDCDKMFWITDDHYTFDVDVEFNDRENPDLLINKESAKELALKIAKVCVEHCKLEEISDVKYTEQVIKMAVKKTKSEEFMEFIEAEKVQEAPSLPSVEADFVEETGMDYDWYSYTRINLNELDDGDEYEGRPLLLPVEVVQFDEEEDPRYRARLLLIDDEGEEYLQINLNLKQKGDVQTKVHNASSLYALIGGIQNLSNPQWTTMFNRIKKVDLSEWETYINSKESMTVEIVTKTGSFSYNSFRITDLS